MQQASFESEFTQIAEIVHIYLQKLPILRGKAEPIL